MTWLHLSDWHQGRDEFDRKVVREALVKDISDRVQIVPTLEQLDFIVFSGDVAWSGKETQYQAAREQLFAPLLRATGLDPVCLFIVPGNHDMDREFVEEMLPAALQQPLTDDAQVQKWLTDERRRARVLEPFEAFCEFVCGYTGQDSPDYASIAWFDVKGVSVALLGLNSAWMCGRHREADGKVNDYGYTLVGEPQIHDALARIADAQVRLVVLHHPFDWLAEFDRNRIEERLEREAHFILRGHQHVSQVKVTSGTSGECVIIPGGASYKRRVAEDSRYTNSYNFVHLNFATARGIVYLRRWSDRRNAWIEDTDAYPSGKYEFDLPAGLGEDEPAPAPPVATPSPPVEDAAARRQAAEDRYRELLLETCDIVGLTNLSGQDRHLAQRQLELRSLYVPLRVWVEMSTAEEKIDEEGEDDEMLWEKLETRRMAQRRGRVARERERVSVGERLGAARRLVVLGDPGAGKTTLTRWIATAYLLRLKQDPEWRELPDVQTLPDQDWLPILVRCRELDEHCVNGNLDDILKHTLRKAELSEQEAAALRGALRARLKAGTAILMLDGLDEITDSAVRARFCEQVERIVVAYPDAPIIATSRIVGYREMGYRLGREFEHVTLADLSQEEKDDFARRWCALTELPEQQEKAAEELIHDIHSAERIERLTGNPMLLTTMALVKRNIGRLPNRRADLYSEAVQVLLNWRSEVDEPLDWREAIPQLEYLAYAMCDRGAQQLRRDEVIDLFRRMREKYPNIYAVQNRTPEEFLNRLEARTGILIEAGKVRHLGMLTPVYEFRHLTFQEYLAARALVDGRFPDRDAKLSLGEHVAPLAGRTVETAFGDGTPTELAVVESWREALRLAVAICSDDDVDDTLLAILTPLEDEPPANSRARAILAALCLADEPNVSSQMVTRVLRVFTTQVREEDGLSGNVRTGIDAAVKELTDTRWVNMLRDTLVREFCQRAGKARRNPGGLVAIISAAAAPQENVKLTKWLVKQVQYIQDGIVTEAIAAALGVMVLSYRGKAQTVPRLIDVPLNRLFGNAPMAFAAAWTLGWLNKIDRLKDKAWRPTASEMERLVAFASDLDSDPYAIRFLTWIFGQEKFECVVEPLILWLVNPIVDVRSEVAYALGKIGDERAVNPLIACLTDTEADVRRAASFALGEIGDMRAVPTLLARLEDAEADVRHAAAETLGKIGDEQAVDPLLVCLAVTEEETGVRRAAAKALGQIGDERAVEPLLARLEDADVWVRRAAASALGKLGNVQAIAMLCERLDSDDAEVRQNALRGLAQSLEETDRKLLSHDLDALSPFLDPRETISEEFVHKTAMRLELTEEEVKSRYEVLAEQFGLRLAWRVE